MSLHSFVFKLESLLFSGRDERCVITLQRRKLRRRGKLSTDHFETLRLDSRCVLMIGNLTDFHADVDERGKPWGILCKTPQRGSLLIRLKLPKRARSDVH